MTGWRFLFGFDPITVSSNALEERARYLPVVHIRPIGIGSGTSEVSGWLWILVIAFLLRLVLR